MAVLIIVLPLIEKQMVMSFELSFDRIQTLLRLWPQK